MRADADSVVLQASSFDACECACGWRRASTEGGARAPNLGCEAAAAPAALRARRGATLFPALGARLRGDYVALACGGVAARAQSHWLG